VRKIVLAGSAAIFALGGCGSKEVVSESVELSEGARSEVRFIMERPDEHYLMMVDTTNLGVSDIRKLVSSGAITGWTYEDKARRLTTPQTIQCTAIALSGSGDLSRILCHSQVLGTVVLSGQNSGLHQFVRLHRQVREGKLSAVAVPMVNPITGK
jgi:hypothetical protein